MVAKCAGSEAIFCVDGCDWSVGIGDVIDVNKEHVLWGENDSCHSPKIGALEKIIDKYLLLKYSIGTRI